MIDRFCCRQGIATTLEAGRFVPRHTIFDRLTIVVELTVEEEVGFRRSVFLSSLFLGRIEDKRGADADPLN